MNIGLVTLNCGYNEKNSFDLKSIKTNVSIHNLLAICTSEFTYENTSGIDQEAKFTFPLQGTCTVFGFEAVVNNSKIIGICKEKEEARNIYESAKEKGIDTSLVERHVDSHDTFNCKVGNIPKKSSAQIILKFIIELKKSIIKTTEDTDRFDLDLPLILTPRYTPAGHSGEPVYLVQNEYEYSFDATIKSEKKIHKVASTSYKLSMKHINDDCTLANVKLVSKYEGKHDLDIHIEYKSRKGQPYIYYESGSKDENSAAFLKTDAAILNFVLDDLVNKAEEVKKNDKKYEFVFIVDRSGSMSGSRIQSAQECLLVFLKSLPINCKFQIYGFGSQFDKAFDSSQLYDENSMRTAMRYQQVLNANMGGTEIMSPLQDMFSNSVASDYTRIAFLLTDGDVGNQREVCNLIQKNQSTTKVYAVGIGDGVSTSLVNEVAQAGNGKAVFVRNSDSLTEKVVNLLNDSIDSLSAICEFQFDLPAGVQIMTIPEKVLTFSNTDFMTVPCIIKGNSEDGLIKGKIVGQINPDGKIVSCPIELIKKSVENTEPSCFSAHYLLAKIHIDHLTKKYNENKNDTLKEELIKLSVEANIMTDFTSFVAVNESQEVLIRHQQKYGNAYLSNYDPTIEDLDSYEYSVMPLSFQNFLATRSAMCAPKELMSKPMKKGMRFSLPKFPSIPKMSIKSKKTVTKCASRKPEAYDEPEAYDATNCDEYGGLDCFNKCALPEPLQKPVPEHQTEVMNLISLQNIMGSWSFDKPLIEKLSLDYDKLKIAKPDEISEEVWMSLIICGYLEKKCSNEKGVWIMVVEKSKKWIKNELSNDDTRYLELEKIVYNLI